MWISSKLEGVHRSLALPAEQGEVNEFLANPENIKRVDSLVDDIFYALMEYQVCTSNYSFPTMSDICTRLRCNKIFIMRIANL